jgi:hypothetical protein
MGSRSPSPIKKSLNQSFSGSRVLIAIAIGILIGSALAYFLKVLIENTPAQIDVRRMRLFYLMVITSTGLAGFAIETTRQLQEEAVDPVYRHPKSKRIQRGSPKR